jgi:hypothetical protein
VRELGRAGRRERERKSVSERKEGRKNTVKPYNKKQ